MEGKMKNMGGIGGTRSIHPLPHGNLSPNAPVNCWFSKMDAFFPGPQLFSREGKDMSALLSPGPQCAAAKTVLKLNFKLKKKKKKNTSPLQIPSQPGNGEFPPLPIGISGTPLVAAVATWVFRSCRDKRAARVAEGRILITSWGSEGSKRFHFAWIGPGLPCGTSERVQGRTHVTSRSYTRWQLKRNLLFSLVFKRFQQISGYSIGMFLKRSLGKLK
ncbi:hypothetical protein CEXT_127701 [Caerostris extrusa]|uniref:Uncharacterized protein n=1 Tax=Caerostris extrusa TaxID=172846 RepID=A0AAV4X1Q4_CAEEX|nr:hypothetical protein CEXT_127701 [Caerostris extrusa]